MPSYSEHSQYHFSTPHYHFSDVLDNITLIYVIRKEIERQVAGEEGVSADGSASSESSGGDGSESSEDSNDSSGYDGAVSRKRSSASSNESSDSDRPENGKIEVKGP